MSYTLGLLIALCHLPQDPYWLLFLYLNAFYNNSAPSVFVTDSL